MSNQINTNEVILALSQSPLFIGISKADIITIIKHIDSRKAHFKKGDVIIEEQTRVFDIGIMLNGAAQAYRLDQSGKRLIVAMLNGGAIFGDVLALSHEHKSPVTIQCTEDVQVLFLPYTGIVERSNNSCVGHERLLRNLLEIIASKYFELQDRIACIIRPTLREKILTYLMAESGNSIGKIFSIPFDRSALAEYLNADRSALSRELSTMKQEGIIDFHKNSFKICKKISEVNIRDI